MLYLLFTDETNLRPSTVSKFFIYGGVFFPADRLSEIHTLVENVRREYGFRPGDEFKFNTRSRPDHITLEQHRDAKRAVLNACAQLDVRFVACLVLHDIAISREGEELVGW